MTTTNYSAYAHGPEFSEVADYPAAVICFYAPNGIFQSKFKARELIVRNFLVGDGQIPASDFMQSIGEGSIEINSIDRLASQLAQAMGSDAQLCKGTFCHTVQVPCWKARRFIAGFYADSMK